MVSPPICSSAGLDGRAGAGGVGHPPGRALKAAAPSYGLKWKGTRGGALCWGSPDAFGGFEADSFGGFEADSFGRF